jgi:hypothetical protein
VGFFYPFFGDIKMSLKEIYSSMSDDDIEQELINNKSNLSYCIELWAEQDRRAEHELLMYEARQA